MGRGTIGSGIEAQLREIERSGGDGTLTGPHGERLDVTNLDKPYFPQDGITKGALMRHYARCAPAILPLLADRPLALKRYPNGITGKSFFQQKAPEHPPEGVRVEHVRTEDGSDAERLVGGNLVTLLYCVQLGAIAIHVWHSRLGHLDRPDYAILDLDPGTEAGLSGAVRVARLIGAHLSRWRLRAAVKTSGSRGLHIAVPLPLDATYEDSAAFAEDLATRVARERPELATIERRLADRSPAAVYVDFLQNARGKTAAVAYCVRARRRATVSWPIPWSALRGGLSMERWAVGRVSRDEARRAARRWTGVLTRRNTRSAFDASG